MLELRSMNIEQHKSRKHIDRQRRMPEVCRKQIFNSNRFNGDWRPSATYLHQNDTYSIVSQSTLNDDILALYEIESDIAEVKQSLQSLYQEVNSNNVNRKVKPTKNHFNDVIDQSNQKFKNPKKKEKKSEKSEEIMRCEQRKLRCHKIIEQNMFILKNLDHVISTLRRDDSRYV